MGEQGFHRHAQAFGDGWQQQDRNTAPAGLVRVDGLLSDADQLGQLCLRDVLSLRRQAMRPPRAIHARAS